MTVCPRLSALVRRVMSGQRGYDQSTVEDMTALAKGLMDAGLLGELGDWEVRRLLTRMKDAAGRADISKEAGKLVDIALGSTLRKSKSDFERATSVRGSRVDSRGVRVQGGLDAHGQVMLGALRDGMKLTADGLRDAMAKATGDIGSGNEPLARAGSLKICGPQKIAGHKRFLYQKVYCLVYFISKASFLYSMSSISRLA